MSEERAKRVSHVKCRCPSAVGNMGTMNAVVQCTLDSKRTPRSVSFALLHNTENGILSPRFPSSIVK